jgi:hypothetical protein
MRRLFVVTVLTAALTAASVATAFAKPPTDAACPTAASGFERVDRAGWWANIVDGFATAGIAVYEGDGSTYTPEFEAFALAFGGFESGQAFVDWILGPMWAGLDLNDNGFLCMKPMPVTTPGLGNPGYYFNGIDDRVQKK